MKRSGLIMCAIPAHAINTKNAITTNIFQPLSWFIDVIRVIVNHYMKWIATSLSLKLTFTTQCLFRRGILSLIYVAAV